MATLYITASASKCQAVSACILIISLFGCHPPPFSQLLYLHALTSRPSPYHLSVESAVLRISDHIQAAHKPKTILRLPNGPEPNGAATPSMRRFQGNSPAWSDRYFKKFVPILKNLVTFSKVLHHKYRIGKITALGEKPRYFFQSLASTVFFW